ncbi:MAG: hypothetical protein HYV61_08280 [Candidatus Rokubacteria bacterium]|nr:hypothetical protein [Candidatus Rokubacteria bacterium]MBI2879795.1 hypothetical protein [Candidatus Rokubacteria bacterium]
MSGVVARLEFDPARGALSYQGVRYLLIRPEPLAVIYRGMLEAGLPPGEVFYRAGYEGGVRSGTHFRERFGQSPEGAVRFMAGMGAEIGWGAMTLSRLDPDQGELVLEVAGSPFAEALGPAAEPVCHLIRGVFGGVAEGLLGWTASAVETDCLATGAPRCVFVVRDLGRG